MKLSDKACKNAKPKEKPYKLSDGGGLFLLVQKNGSRYWRYKYRMNGKEKLIALGVYPEVSLKEARDKHKESHKLVSEGIDPQEKKQADEHARIIESSNTFERVARDWHNVNSLRWEDSNARRILIRLEKDIFPVIGCKPINEITAPQLLLVIRGIQKRGAHDIAKRNLQNCGRVFRHGIVTGRCDRDVAADLKDCLLPAKKKHHPSIDISEIPKFLEDLETNKSTMYIQTYWAIKLLMLVFVRPNKEFIRAEWGEFNFEDAAWIVPAHRMKMKLEHIVPLSKQALAILKQLKELNGWNKYVFVGRNDPQKHMSDNTILKALYDMGYKGRMTGHGFRSLALSAAKEKLGYRHEVPDRQLAHVPQGEVNKAYDRAKFMPDRIKMMQEWADYLDSFGRGNGVITGKFK